MSTMPNSRRLKVLWLTNIATPYRIPLWRWLSGEVDLTMALLSNTEQNRWWNFTAEDIGIRAEFLEAPALRYGEKSIYLPSLRLRRLLNQDFDAVILGGWESPAYAYALFKARRRGIKTIGHYGSTMKSHGHSAGILAKIRSWYYRSLDWHVSYGTAATETLINMGVAKERIETGFNSVDHGYFFDSTKQLRENGDSALGHKFIYVGQLLERKNLDELLKAFAEIRHEADSLRIVGSGPIEASLKAQATKLGLGDSVVFTGPKTGDALLQEYADANTLVLPSSNEVWGLVINEALASGLHVVVSDQCGASDDVAKMVGVFISDCTASGISKELDASRTSWTGPIAQPEIASITPAVYGGSFLRALAMAAELGDTANGQ